MKKVFSIVFTVFMLFSVVSLTAFAVSDEEEKTWTTSFDEATGTLTVSGTGVVDGLYPLDGFAYNGKSYAKEENYDIKKLVIEEGITGLSVSFSYLYELTEIIFPTTLRTIDCCFNYCDKLQSVEFPANVDRIGYHSFSDCKSLSTIKFNSSVSIGYKFDETITYDFSNLPSLKEITIHNGFLGGAFWDCENLTKVVMDGYVDFRENSDANGCALNFGGKNSENLVIYVTNQFMENQLKPYFKTEKTWTTSFDKATGTLTVSGTGVVDGLYPLDCFAYNGESYEKEENFDIKKLVIEEGITGLSVSFSYLHELKEIVFPSTLKSIDCCFNYCDKLESVDIPANVKKIGNHSFNDCESLKRIKFNDWISIGDRRSEFGERILYDFSNLPSLKEVTIPDGSFLGGAFWDCENLTKVVMEGHIDLGGNNDCNGYAINFGGEHSENLVVYVNTQTMVDNLKEYCEYEFGVDVFFKIVNRNIKPEFDFMISDYPEFDEDETVLKDNLSSTNDEKPNYKAIIIISVVSAIILATVTTIIILKKKK